MVFQCLQYIIGAAHDMRVQAAAMITVPVGPLPRPGHPAQTGREAATRGQVGRQRCVGGAQCHHRPGGGGHDEVDRGQTNIGK